MDALQLALARARFCPKPNGNGHAHHSNLEARLEALEKAFADLTAKLSTYVESYQQSPAPPAEPSEPAIRIRPSIAKIKSVVCAAYNVTPNDLESEQRGQKIVWPRQIAIYLACRLTTKNLTTIGRQFGNRDHTTIIHSRNKVGELRAANEVVRNELIALEAKLA